MRNFVFEISPGMNTRRRTHRGLPTWTHLGLHPSKIFAFKRCSDFQHCRVIFASLNNKCGIWGICRLPVKQKRARHPFGHVFSRLPQSEGSLCCPRDKDHLVFTSVPTPTLRVKNPLETWNSWATTLFEDIKHNRRLERRLRLKTSNSLNTMARTPKGDLSAQCGTQRLVRKYWLQYLNTALEKFWCIRPSKSLNYRILWWHCKVSDRVSHFTTDCSDKFRRSTATSLI